MKKKPMVLIMAGGKGERFWPKSTISKPKQLQKIYSNKTLLEETLQRAKLLTSKENIFIGCNPELKKSIQSFLSIDDEQFILEPFGKNTAPIVALASLYLEKKFPERVHIILSADHYIHPLTEFKKTMEKAIELAEKGFLVTCGVIPNRPEIGYGYIQKGDPIENSGYEVKQFHEKPDISRAIQYLKRGYYWNSGIFIWKGKTIIEEFKNYAADIYEPIENSYRSFKKLKKAFQKIPELPIDIAVMEKSRKISVVEASFRWDDVGTWLSLERIFEQDSKKSDDNNIVLIPTKAHQFFFHSYNNIVLGDSKKLYAFLGIENIVLVETENTIFIAKKEKLNDIKEMLKSMKQITTLHKYI